jgi:hypothetical protein
MEINQISSQAASSYYAAQQQQQQQQMQQTQEAKTANETSAPAESTTSAPPTVTAKDNVQITSSVTLKNLDTVRGIELVHARMNQQIKSVRETNEALNKEATQVEQMSTNLNSIMKNFPPFPVSSKERQEILMSYTSLRQEILKMMVPPPPQQIYDQVKDTWKSLFADNGQLLPSAVPPLQPDSSDASVKDAAKGLDTTGQKLAGLSSSITQALFQG